MRVTYSRTGGKRCGKVSLPAVVRLCTVADLVLWEILGGGLTSTRTCGMMQHMPARDTSREMIDRVLPGGLATWFTNHEGVPVRRLPAALAQTELIDGEPLGIEFHERTLRDWKSRTKEQNQ